MSLSALNSPPLVSTAAICSAFLFGMLEKGIDSGSITWSACTAANACAYAVNFMATSVPGRLDGAQAQTKEKDNNNNNNNQRKRSPSKEMEPISTGRRGRTLFTPAGWAFAIWAPIFLGELISVSTQLFVPCSAPIVSFLKQLTAPYVVANAFQSLWTAAFRPKYQGISKFVSPGLLGATAYSLSKANAAICAANLSFGQYLLYAFPLSLHFGWVTAASLVNCNGAVATFSDNVSAKTVAAVGHLSVIAATALGVIVTITRGAPVYGGVISWALFAVADGMGTRIKETKDEDKKRVGVLGCRVQRRLSQVGAFVCALASAVAMAQEQHVKHLH